jgi:hypothetical protein
MKGNRFARGLKFLGLVVIAVAIKSYFVMLLWNWLTPELFGWHMIGYGQAVGILLLCKILFGGFRGRGGPGMHWRRRMMERWEQMTPEEREKFRQGMRGGWGGGCGPFSASGPPSAPKP